VFGGFCGVYRCEFLAALKEELASLPACPAKVPAPFPIDAANKAPA